MKESMYYTVYDISDDSSRTAVIQTLKNTGFTRIQKSVFCGKMSNQQKKDLIETVKTLINNEKDSFYVILACKNCFGKIRIVGKGFDKDYVSDETSSVVL